MILKINFHPATSTTTRPASVTNINPREEIKLVSDQYEYAFRKMAQNNPEDKMNGAKSFLKELKAINCSKCPSDFQQVFKSHVSLWEKAVAAGDKNKTDNSLGDSLIKSFEELANVTQKNALYDTFFTTLYTNMNIIPKAASDPNSTSTH